jgi:3-methyladenine DNA glycosylase AlkD
MNAIISKIRAELKRQADERVRASGQRFFREKVKLYGLKSAMVGQIAKSRFADIKGLSKDEILGLCEQLWQSGFMEESFVACDWSYRLRKQYEDQDFKTFERWVSEYVGNWASCDTLCNHSVGAFVELYPKHLADLKKWAKSKNRWLRRAAAVTLIIPARNGKFLKEVFELVDILLLDADDLVQKGYGWLLKAASETHQQEVFRYVLANKQSMPRTALRYAIEKMPPELRRRAMAKCV